MKQFEYVIKDEVGLHARPAGLLTKKAKEFKSEITVEKAGKSASAAKLMALMAMGIKCGDKITVTISGEDEEKASLEIEKFLKDNL